MNKQVFIEGIDVHIQNIDRLSIICLYNIFFYQFIIFFIIDVVHCTYNVLIQFVAME